MSGHRVLIIGAKRRNQGLGEFIAQYFHQAGAEICGIVGTTPESVKEAAHHLQAEYGIQTRGFTGLEEAIEQSGPTIVVIASPTGVHRSHLETVAKYQLSCFCEKPLFWDDPGGISLQTVENIVDGFCGAGQLLQLITQWPQTLDEYYTLYPEVKGRPVERFQMLLGPVAFGVGMAIDSLPHVLSMVHCLTGLGEVHGPRAVMKSPEHMQIVFGYRHGGGDLKVEVDLIRSPNSPRPGGYAINGRSVKRSVILPEYQIVFTDDSGHQIALEDPLKKRVRQYLADVESKKSTSREQLIASMKNLMDVVENIHL